MRSASPWGRSGTARGEERPAALTQRSGAHQLLRTRQDLPRATAAEQRVDAELLGVQTELLQTSSLRRAGGQRRGRRRLRPRHRARASPSRKATRSLSPSVSSSRARATRASNRWASTSSAARRGGSRGTRSRSRRAEHLRSRTMQDWMFLVAEAGGRSPQTASASCRGLTGWPSRVARACRTTRSRGPRRPGPSTVSGPRTLIPTPPRSAGVVRPSSERDTSAIPALDRGDTARQQRRGVGPPGPAASRSSP